MRAAKGYLPQRREYGGKTAGNRGTFTISRKLKEKNSDQNLMEDGAEENHGTIGFTRLPSREKGKKTKRNKNSWQKF